MVGRYRRNRHNLAHLDLVQSRDGAGQVLFERRHRPIAYVGRQIKNFQNLAIICTALCGLFGYFCVRRLFSWPIYWRHDQQSQRLAVEIRPYNQSSRQSEADRG